MTANVRLIEYVITRYFVWLWLRAYLHEISIAHSFWRSWTRSPCPRSYQFHVASGFMFHNLCVALSFQRIKSYRALDTVILLHTLGKVFRSNWFNKYLQPSSLSGKASWPSPESPIPAPILSTRSRKALAMLSVSQSINVPSDFADQNKETGVKIVNYRQAECRRSKSMSKLQVTALRNSRTSIRKGVSAILFS